jgi:PAS domain S-box-containing protein
MEELQSTNEELETAKEELQSSNEELITLNEQAQNRNAELAQLTDDLTNVLGGVNIPILMLGGDRRIRRFTPTAEKLLHLLPSDVGRPIRDIRLGLAIPDLDDLISAVLDGGRELEREARAEDGRVYSVRMRPYRTRERKIDGVLVALVDIHELQQSRDDLRKEGSILSNILDAAKDLLVVVLDREGRIVRFNRVCQEFTGYSLQEVKGRRSWDFLEAPEEIASIKTAFAELLGGGSRKWQSHWLTKDGRRRLIDWSNSVALGDEGAVEYAILAGIDITERQEAEEHARESQATVEALLETAAQAILAVNSQGQVVLANAAAEVMFGYSRKEMLDQAVENLIPKGRLFLGSAHPPMGAGLDLAGLRKDGTEFPVEISLSHVETAQGTLAVAFITDITERKQGEDALRKSEAAARVSQEQLRALTTRLLEAQEEERRRVSRELHDDLNQRLALLAVEVGEMEGEIPDSASALREQLQSVESRLNALSDDVRRTAYQLHPSVLEHLGLADALESYCTDFAKQEAVKVRFRRHNVPKAIPEGAALCLYRVTQECLRNVAKHSGAAKASVTLAAREAALVLTVSDTGRGFDAASVKGKGGLGLVSIEERVMAAGGTLTIQTRPGDGTRIQVRIPLPGGFG